MSSKIKFLFPEIHKGVASISYATAIRFFGWGLFEALLPIFLFSFSESYLETGLLRSVFSIFFLLCIPIVSTAVNSLRSNKVIIAGLAIYPTVGISYFLAGAFGMVWGIVLARAFNALGYAMDSVGRSTYIRRVENKQASGKAFGFMSMIPDTAWIIAVLISILFVDTIPFHYLFLALIPTHLAAMVIVSKIQDDPLPAKKVVNLAREWKRFFSLRTYKFFISEIIMWRGALRRLAILTFTSGVVFSAIDFFLPISLYESGAPLIKIIFFSVIYTLPALFGAVFGNLADRFGVRGIIRAFPFLIASFVALGFTDIFALQVFFAVIASSFGLFISIVIDAEMTKRGDKRKYGTVSGGLLEVDGFSSILGPIIVGALVDLTSLQSTMFILASVLLVFLVFNYKFFSQLEKPKRS